MLFRSKSYRVSDKPSKDKKEKVRKTVPVFTLETELGIQKISVFDVDDMRVATKNTSNSERLNLAGVQAFLK